MRLRREEVLPFTLTTDLSELDRLHAMMENFAHMHHLDKRIVFETSLTREGLFTNILAYGPGIIRDSRSIFSCHKATAA